MTHDDPFKTDDGLCPQDCLDIWIRVLQIAVTDFQRGIQQGQHRKVFIEGPIARFQMHRGRHDAEDYRDWVSAAHWLLSDETDPGSFRWVMRFLPLDVAEFRARLKQMTKGKPA